MKVPSAVRASVIVVSYNSRPCLRRCVEALLQSLGPAHEIILVDNASVDDSAAEIERSSPQVRLVRNPRNLGFGGGCNVGARQARGRYLAFLNPDTVVAAGWLEALLEALETGPAVGLATSKILLLDDPERINTCGNSVHLTGLALCRGLGRPAQDFEQVERVMSVSGAAFAMRRELFESLGGFDEAFFLYMEDTDLSWRARLAGWRCVYVPASVVWHAYSLRITPAKVFYQERNRYRLLLKSLRWPTLVILLPALVLAEAVTWGFVLWRDRPNWRNKLQAYAAIVADWPAIMRRRREVQSLRRVGDREILRELDFALDLTQVAEGRLARWARRLLNVMFFAWRSLMFMLVWW